MYPVSNRLPIIISPFFLHIELLGRNIAHTPCGISTKFISLHTYCKLPYSTNLSFSGFTSSLMFSPLNIYTLSIFKSTPFGCISSSSTKSIHLLVLNPFHTTMLTSPYTNKIIVPRLLLILYL